jgi:hypothetical protein
VVYHEGAALKKVVEKVLDVTPEIELIGVDDGSRHGSSRFSVGNWLLTLASNVLTNINHGHENWLQDISNFRTAVIQSIPLEENRFGFGWKSQSSVDSGFTRLVSATAGYLRGRKEDWVERWRARTMVPAEVFHQGTDT